MNNFFKWLEENNESFLFPNVDIRLIDKSTGYGLFTNENVRMNQILLKIPEKYIITAHFVANIREYSDILTRFTFDSSELLALFFAFERIYFDYFCKQTGGFDETIYLVQWTLGITNGLKKFLDSRNYLKDEKQEETDLWWKSYIDILPRNFSTPLFIYYLKENGQGKIKEIAAQLPLESKERLLGQLTELTIFEGKFFNLLNNSPDDEENSDKNSTEMSENSINFWREICCWAWHIVNTRSIFTENLPSFPFIDKQKSSDQKKKKSTDKEDNFRGSLALVPLMDMINHSPEAQCVPIFDKKLNCYKVIAEHSIGAGQQLFFCYGAHNNDQLWVDYGFRLLENPFNRLNISIDLFIALAERCGQRVESLRKEILKKARLPCTIYATDEIPSYALRKNCSILLMEKSKLTNWSQYIFSNDENEEEEEEENIKSLEIKLIGAILRKLENSLIARKNECFLKEICLSWEDQIEILQRMLANICEVY